MAAQENLPRLPKNVRFRVLIIGRANAGKTSILQRVCNTTERPVIDVVGSSGTPKRIQLEPLMEHGPHNIEDEITFAEHDGYVFHDFRGFEVGDEMELKIVQDFVRRRSEERQLAKRLHAIWYCIPMDNARPSLDLANFDKICPDENIKVPVIAVFTKYDQLVHETSFRLEDQGLDSSDAVLLDTEVEKIFREQYLAKLPVSAPAVNLERMHEPGRKCTELIEKTGNELSSGIVALMLLAVQKDNLAMSINQAVQLAHSAFKEGNYDAENLIKICILAFPSLWLFVSLPSLFMS